MMLPAYLFHLEDQLRFSWDSFKESILFLISKVVFQNLTLVTHLLMDFKIFDKVSRISFR